MKLLIVMTGGGRHPSVFAIGVSDWFDWTIFYEIGREIAVGIALGIAGGIALGIALGIAFGIAFGIALGIAVGIAGGIAVGIAFGIAFGIAVGIAGGIALTRAYYLPFHLFFVWPIAQGRWYRTHPVAWDDLCSVPFPRLDRLLVAYAQYDPAAARREIERLTDRYPTQREAALSAQTTLIARAAAKTGSLNTIDAEIAGLPEGDKGFLAQVPLVWDLVGPIAATQRQLDLVSRPVLREPIARRLVSQIETFSQRVAGLREPLASEFRAAARQWRVIADRQWREAEAVVLRDPTPQVFRAGDPANVDNEAFIERTGVIGDIAAQLELATGCPGLVLYGRRRTGKSTILRNLPRFLGPGRIVATISMQDPMAFTSLAYFVTRIAAALEETVASEPNLPALFDALANANTRLLLENEHLLLAIDEYEAIDQLIGDGVFPLRLLDTIRESIQTHRRIIWIFAGSHEIGELTHASWSSYLISARTIEVPLFTLPETTLLLTEPMRHSSLWERNDPARPRYDAALWGEGGIARVHTEAGGWPHLVQLIAETIIDLLNQGTARHADAALMEQALDKAIVSGDTVLRQLVQGESRLPGEWDYVSAFRRVDTQPPPADEAIDRSLRRRLLVIEESGAWRLRVPLMQRWLRQRG